MPKLLFDDAIDPFRLDSCQSNVACFLAWSLRTLHSLGKSPGFEKLLLGPGFLFGFQGLAEFFILFS